MLLPNLWKLWPDSGLYILDSKGDPKDFGGWDGIVEQDGPPKPLRGPGIQIWRPSYDDLGAYDDWFDSIRGARRPAIILVDELSTISDKSGEAVQGYQKCQKLGRGLGISTITFTQELAGIDRRTVGQMTHFLGFGLLTEYDQRRRNVLMGLSPKHPEPADKYGFWYLRVDQKPYKALYYESYKRFF